MCTVKTPIQRNDEPHLTVIIHISKSIYQKFIWILIIQSIQVHFIYHYTEHVIAEMNSLLLRKSKNPNCLMLSYPNFMDVMHQLFRIYSKHKNKLKDISVLEVNKSLDSGESEIEPEPRIKFLKK